MEDKVRFLMESLDLIAQTQGNAERVYAFWQMNINKIDASLIQIMSDIGSQMLTNKRKEERESTARTFANFGELIQNFLLGNRSINLELAITIHLICASIFTRNEYPRIWATIQANLGSAYSGRTEGNRKQNIELAIQTYQAALEVYTQQDFPIEWARIQDNLENLYAYCNQDTQATEEEAGKKDKVSFLIESLKLIEWTQGNAERVYAFWRINIDKIDAWLIQIMPTIVPQILAVGGKEMRESIVNALGRFGDLMQMFPDGNRGINIELAIASYQICASIFTRNEYPSRWAMYQNNLGFAYSYRIAGERKENIELAIAACRASLEAYTRQAFPVGWATSQYNLGFAYLYRIAGERKENIELAIAACYASLEIRTRQAFPVEWATSQYNLGFAYLYRLAGERKENIELAIVACRASLEVYTRQTFPVEWATSQTNLGFAYLYRIAGERKENIELAIAACHTSLEIRTRQVFPVEWAGSQTNLGAAYLHRIAGERKENIELAIAACRASLEVYTRQTFPVEWAGSQNNLGIAYLYRLAGEPKENIELAIAACRASLEVYTRQTFPVEWARSQNNLGIIYDDRIEGERKENIELAIAAYHASLEVYTRQTFPVEWARSQNNLGVTYNNRVEGERKENIELAIAACRASLEVYTRQAFPVEWAGSQTNLGNAYCNRISGEHKENIELAIQAYRAALEVNQPELLPFACLQTGRNLGNLGFKEGDWHIAIEGFEKSITAVETSRSWAMSDRRRQEILDESIGIYEKMLQSCINANRLDLALQTVERVRSKRLVDLMAAPDLYPQGEIPEPVRLILDHIATTQQQMDDLRSGVQSSASELVGAGIRDRAAVAPPTAEIQALEVQKQTLLDELSRYDAVSAQLVDITPLDISQTQTELLDRPDVALLSFYTTTQDTHILVLRSDSIQCFTCLGQGLEQLQGWLHNEWVLLYINNQTSWQQNMPQRLQQLAEKLELDRLVTEHLEDVRELILIPHLYLHLIPFAALPLNENQQYLGDRFLLRYAPGCQVLKFCTDRNPLSSQQYGTVENATEDLPFATIEGEAIAQIFSIEDINRLRGSQQATSDAYHQLLKRVNSVASCHHAQSRLDNPLESALILADGMRITLGELLSPAWRFADLSDVFLSCCETGMTMPQSFTDELLTLGTGFLCAGARSVISSLWAVSDLATAILSQIYHHYRAQGQDRIVALQKAQQDLRCMSGEQLKALSETKFIPALLVQQEQLEQHRQTARRQQQQSKVKRYGEIIDRLVDTQISLEQLWERSLPFDHPVYWAPFTCQGLR
jgi:CHAT domain-containing protein